MIRLKSKCKDCSDCETKVIASFTTNRDNPIWDLTPYQGDGVGDPNTKWRVFEKSGGVQYYDGDINENGKLVGLPNEFESSYYYDGFMELQQGCPDWCCNEEEYYCDPQWPS